MARALTLAAGIVLLAVAGTAFLFSLLVIIPGGETDADTWLGAGILLGVALVVGGLADLLVIKGLRPRAPRPAAGGQNRSASSWPAAAHAEPGLVQAASAAPTGAGRRSTAGGVDLGSTLGPALNEVGSQLFGVAGVLLAGLLTALLERRWRARREPAPPVSSGQHGPLGRVRGGLRTAMALICLVLWVSAVGGLLGVAEGFVNAPATAWNTLTGDLVLQVALGLCLGVASIGLLVLTRTQRG